MNKDGNEFIQSNSPDGGFLQSEEWRKFQEAYGRKTFPHPNPLPEGEGDLKFWANIIEHKLKLVGNYFYIPRGPIIGIMNQELGIKDSTRKLIELAKEEKAGWIRIEPASNEILKAIRETFDVQEGHRMSIAKAPHDMQPREIFVIDITKPEEQLLAEMKGKTRYNIKLAEKKGVCVFVIASDCKEPCLPAGRRGNPVIKCTNPEIAAVVSRRNSLAMTDKYFKEFLRLVKITFKRNEINPHPEKYYKKLWETIPSANLKLYTAEYQGKIISANLVLYYGKVATYLHGASDNNYREVMAPYLLQWRMIQDAQKAECSKYDFGGVSLKQANKLQGVTKFKLGFSPETKAIEFPGSYDIIINSRNYYIYRAIQSIKSFGKKVKIQFYGNKNRRRVY